MPYRWAPRQYRQAKMYHVGFFNAISFCSARRARARGVSFPLECTRFLSDNISRSGRAFFQFRPSNFKLEMQTGDGMSTLPDRNCQHSRLLPLIHEPHGRYSVYHANQAKDHRYPLQESKAIDVSMALCLIMEVGGIQRGRILNWVPVLRTYWMLGLVC